MGPRNGREKASLPAVACSGHGPKGEMRVLDKHRTSLGQRQELPRGALPTWHLPPGSPVVPPWFPRGFPVELLAREVPVCLASNPNEKG